MKAFNDDRESGFFSLSLLQVLAAEESLSGIIVGDGDGP